MENESYSRYSILKRDDFQCIYCGTSPRLNRAILCLDHIIPFSKDGKTTAGNLVVACRRCNSGKGMRSLSENIRAEILAEVKRRNKKHDIVDNLYVRLESRRKTTTESSRGRWNVTTEEVQNKPKGPNKRMRAFQAQFRTWLGTEPNKTTVAVAERSGYSVKYVRWVAGLSGKRPWPGSRRFVKAMAALGCSNRRWRDRAPEEIKQAFRNREVLHDPFL